MQTAEQILLKAVGAGMLDSQVVVDLARAGLIRYFLEVCGYKFLSTNRGVL